MSKDKPMTEEQKKKWLDKRIAHCNESKNDLKKYNEWLYDLSEKAKQVKPISKMTLT